jgi:hypothetical protein
LSDGMDVLRLRILSVTPVLDSSGNICDVDFTVWRQNVLGAARRAADRSYQERVWFGHDPQRRGSPGDLICTFMDDLVFEEFLLDPRLPKREREAAARLYKAVEEYADSTPQVLNPSDVIDDPKFERVRIAAREFLKIAESAG